MDDAFAAGGFFLLKRTLVESQKSVITEFTALSAEFSVLCAMVVSAVDFNHVADGFLFSSHAFMVWVWWLRLHIHHFYGVWRLLKAVP